ncbi:ribonucleotide-diphosphate reductase subunit beta [Chlamydia sp.]|uniref:ribonucleotide-diphosphate reductase subunit beta n=1 Tax=Chlamydia sp. TaxID=35827 RepID=UPI0025C5CF4C|nr:ribonucleotide-diphosphate reductase subunit beta [Chlamydia sp.]MBQ8498525.1 ribonucleotide-diphosphate reductase subunit beta [Chlamydia sp.]
MQADILDGKQKRVNLNSKRLVNCNQVDVNQLVPIKYKWAWEHYLNGCANNWLPTEIPMGKDIELWKSDLLSEDERRVILLNLGFFSTAESLVGNNIVLAIFKHVTNPEARQYLLRQAFEEAVHTHTFLYICESRGLDEKEIFNAYNERATIKAKDDFQMEITGKVLDPNFCTDSVEGLREFIKNLVGYYIIMEGIFFYSGFVMILSFHRQNKMIGIGEQYQYILRDETIHLNFGLDLINGIKEENPEVWTPELQQEIIELIQRAVDLEIDYAKDCLPRGILGLRASMFIDYVQHIADRRLERIGLKPIYHTKNPFPWMSETIDLNKEKNFFETRVTEYQHAASLTW